MFSPFTHLSFFTRHSEAILHRHSEATLRTKRDFGIDLRQIPTPSAQFAEESQTHYIRHSEFNSESIQTKERKANDK